MENCLFCSGWRPVFVRAYTRIRFGRLEYVIQHCRSRPGQHRFNQGF